MGNTRGPTRIAPLVIALALIGGACGGSSQEGPTITGLGQVASAAEAAGSARFDGRMEMAFGGQTTTFVIDGVVDTVTGEGPMTLRGEGASAGAVGENEIRVVDGWMYLRGTMASGYAPTATVPPDSWIAIDMEQLTALAGQGQAAMFDFSQTIDWMRAAGAEVEELGEDVINEIPVTGMRAELTMAALYEQRGITLEDVVDASVSMQPPELRDGAREQMRQRMETMADIPAEVEVWFDADGLPRRNAMTLDITEMMSGLTPPGQQGAGGDTTAVMTMTYNIHEYGVPVEVEAPPEDEVITPA